jgi:hypothetical protein
MSPILRNRRRLMAGLVVLAFMMPSAAWAASAWLTTKITEVGLSGGNWGGGCRAKLTANPAVVIPGCMADWVTFSCSGEFTDNVRAYRMCDLAQLALVTDRYVAVNVTDDMTANGVCFASDIFLLK